MRICFYAPFKPLGHPNPSGDLVIAKGLYEYLLSRGHKIQVMSHFRARWVFWKPWRWIELIWERRRCLRWVLKEKADIWMTYHSYYKAPDLIGPFVSKRLKIPYIIFQGIYSTKRKRDWRTWLGYQLNKDTLCAANHVLSNRKEDWKNLQRLLPQKRLTYIVPGIYPEDFYFDANARTRLHSEWNVGNEAVILSAAMFRPGVKTEGLIWVIRVCGKLLQKGYRFHLVIAGQGKEKENLMRMADIYLPGRFRFLGKISREKMYQFYSAGDLFVFPGIRESLGMVFLEAQSCGLPVLAFDNGGIPEVVQHGKTGFLCPVYDLESFLQTLESLLKDKMLRQKMGKAAQVYVRQQHDLNLNYLKMEKILNQYA